MNDDDVRILRESVAVLRTHRIAADTADELDDVVSRLIAESRDRPEPGPAGPEEAAEEPRLPQEQRIRGYRTLTDWEIDLPDSF
jgi:hypothetical protein